MTDADQTANTVGDVPGSAMQFRDVGGDVTITQYGTPKRPPTLLLIAVVVCAAVVGLLVVVMNLGPRTGPASESTTPSTRQKPANDGPGYLVPAGDDRRAVDFYQNDWNDVVMWERHPSSDTTSFQPYWVREFSDASPTSFRIRNERANLCMEPVYQQNFGEHIKANSCSWSNDAQLWQTTNTTQLAHVASGRCLGTANDGSYADGTWLIVSLCSGRDDQKWRIAR
ncbi:RICIN domain-containing protein [Lentzea aerocolonigenes]|uniref:RICIN domain-containing protein n=1 Tax=Lentzea aerocolonigenes TaxID=68170 RepID=UPI0004C409D4|nr:RICIN domain-containing protein [Lentzea aerocolonigenes]MCP2243070.1 Ricin-type beta-trefoil lectin domain-containing protein [Lentzea aerocolonigenes]